MIQRFLLFIFLSIAFQVGAQNATIQGVISDDTGLPVGFADIEVVGGESFYSDDNGNYSITLDPGTYQLNFSAIDYGTDTQTITLGENETIQLDVVLSMVDSNELDAVTVVAQTDKTAESALLKDVQKSEVIKQNIGSEEMSRKGVGNAKEGLSKVTGITFVENRGLVVRGLEDRYNNLLINHLAVPSNNPFKKIIALDLLPTDIVGVMEIYKTYNPDIYGDFAGATVNVKTSEGQKSMTKIDFGFQYTTDNNVSPFVFAKDNEGFNGYYGWQKDRRLPAVFGSVPEGKAVAGNTAIETFKDGFDTYETLAPISNSYGITNSGKISNNNWKYILTANFSNDYQKRKGVERTFNLGQGNYDNNFEYQQYDYKTLFNGLAALKYDNGRTRVAGNFFYLRSTESEIKDQTGVYNSLVNNPNHFIRTNQFQSADFMNGQLTGDFYLTDSEKHQIKSGISYTTTKFSQPDRKFLVGNKLEGNNVLLQYGGNNMLRQYLDLNGNYQASAFAEYNLKFGKNNDQQNRFTVGYNGSFLNMRSDFRFIFGVPGNDNEPYETNLDNVDAHLDEDLEAGRVYFRDLSTGDYRTKLTQNINAGYVNSYFKFNDVFEGNFGIRLENEERVYNYRTVFSGYRDPYLTSKNNKLDILPAINLKYQLNFRSNLRFAASKTVTKPVIMERFPLNYINADNTIVSGNIDLKDSDNYNAEFKYEMFPSNTELLTFSAFGKYLINPIERAFKNTANSGGQIITYYNSKNATLFGFEVESMFSLKRISEGLSHFTLGFNISYLNSKVKISEEQQALETFNDRPLQGASNWLVNADLKYDFKINQKFDNTLNLVYNVYSKRIYAVGTAGFDNMYEMPFNQLDLVWSGQFTKNWGIKFMLSNILNPKFKYELGDKSLIPIQEPSLLMKDYKVGTGFSLSLNYTF